MEAPEVLMNSTPRLALLSLTAAIGALFLSSAAAAQSDEDLRSSVKKFTQLYQAVEANFADKVDADRLVYRGAIPGMLRTLDPHSNFFDAKAWQILREGQAGHYYGVGMLVGQPEGKVLVLYPFQGSPAYRAGLHPGDRIIAVDDRDATKLNVSDVSALLKAPRGTKARIVVRREGNVEPLIFGVVRDEVPRGSVNHTFWIRPGIAYMKVDAFNETTGHEVDAALAKFGESSIEGLVLDLRNNPGGLVNEAVNVADHFLHKGQTIVSHHGRASAEAKFTARKGERGPEYPIVVLVDRGSASASEILAGALQDHDRAWIMGENTFGKGLVQAPFPLSGNAALLLTIAHYYTPSGRLIQREYANRSFYEYYSRLEGKNNPKDLRKTDSGRVVYGGDGIAPDERYETPKLDTLEETLQGRLGFFYFAAEYFGNRPATLSKDWRPDEAVMSSFRAFLTKRGAVIEDKEWARDRPWIEDRLRDEFFITAFSKEESEQFALQHDPEVLKAVDSLPASKALLQKAKEVVASKTAKKSSTPGVAEAR